MVMHKQTNGRRMIGETGRMYIPGMKAEGAIEAGTPTNVGTIDDTGTVRETGTDTEQSLGEIVIIEATETVATIEIEKGTGTGTVDNLHYQQNSRGHPRRLPLLHRKMKNSRPSGPN